MKIVVRVAHAVDRTELRRRVEARLAHYSVLFPNARLADLYKWSSPHEAEARYRGSRARLTLADGDVELEADLPFFARPLRARIEAFLWSEVTGLTQSAAGPTQTQAAFSLR